MKGWVMRLLVAWVVLTGCTRPIPDSGQLSRPGGTAIPPNPTDPSIADVDWKRASLHMINQTDGWALAPGAVLRTSDGGRQWTKVTPSRTTLPESGVAAHFLDAHTGWLAIPGSSQLAVFRTADGGKTWYSAHIETSGHQLELSFPDQRHGWILAHQGVALGSEQVAVYRTENGGADWAQVAVASPDGAATLPFGGLKRGIRFLNAAVGWVTAEDRGVGHSRVWQTPDGGHTWAEQSLVIPGEFQNHSLTVYPPRFFATTEGILPVVFVPGYRTIFYTTRDGGATWETSTPVHASPDTAAPVYDFVDRQHGWATNGISLFRTDDGGRTWGAITPNLSFQGVRQIQFVMPQIGWAITDEGLIQTHDGGQTWKAVRVNKTNG